MDAQLAQWLQQSVGDTYTLERELGGGGMSHVFLATEAALDRKVVLKVLAPAGLNTERFAREIRTASHLQHPHIVPVLAAGTAALGPGLSGSWYAMPFVEGETLRARIEQGGALPVPEAVGILRDVALALEYAHGHGIVHRDIKPANVLLTGRSATVTDFGIAKAISASADHTTDSTLTATGTVLGTPAYMAPEQAAGDPHTDHRADLYAWGLLAYEMLTGRHPFADRHTAQELVSAHVLEAPVPLVDRRPDVPAPLAGLVMRCLAKRPDERPASARAVLDALEAVPGPAVAPGTDDRPRPIPPAVRRWGRPAAAIAALAAVLVWTFTRDPRPAANDARATASPIRSLAVLPLTNVGTDSTQDFFADGLTEELTSALGHIPGLRVASRTSAATFRGTPGIDIREAGRRLGVNAVLEGSVRFAGPRLRIAVQLTSVADGLGLWSQTYEREVRDIFVVQADITAAIAEALQLTLGVAPRVADVRSIDPETYAQYLRGRHLASLGTRQGLERSLELLRDVLQREPSFAPAQAAIGTVWMNLADAFVPPHEAYPRVIDAARRAIQLDSSVAEGHSLLAVGAMYQRDWQTVERELARVRALTTSDPLALLTESFYRLMTADSSGTIAATRRLLQVDPLTPWTNHTTSRQFILAGALEEGLAQARRAEEVAPDFLYGDSFTGYAYLASGLVDEALQRFEAASRTLGRPTPGLAKAYAVAGRRADARRVLGELEALAKREYVFSPQLIAEAWATLGDYDRAFVWLDRSIRSGDAGAPLIPAIPEFAPMRSDPRWVELMRQLGIGVSPPGSRAIP